MVFPQTDRRPGPFPAVRLSHLEADELPNTGDRRGSEAQRRGKGDPSPRQVTYVPFDPSFEMPDEGQADYESMQHLSVMRAFAPRLGGYLSGLVWRLFLWRNGMPGCRSRALSGGVR